MVLFTLHCLPFSPVGPAALGLSPIRLCAVATSGFLPEAGGPRISPSLSSFPSSSHFGVPSPPVTHCPSLLWIPEKLLCLQSDIWGLYRPWLLGPTLPQLVSQVLGRGTGKLKWRRAGPLSLPSEACLPLLFTLLALGRCSLVWVPLQWIPCPP